MRYESEETRYKFRTPVLVALGWVLAGPFSPMLLIFAGGFGFQDKSGLPEFAFWTISLPASLGVTLAIIFFERSVVRTAGALLLAVAYSVFWTVLIYPFAYAIISGAFALRGSENWTLALDVFIVTLLVFLPGLIWGGLVAAASFIPFRIFALERINP